MWMERTPSPLGEILLVGDGEALVSLDFSDCEERMETLLRRRFGAVSAEERTGSDASGALQAYFAGDFGALDRLAIAPRGTEFQQTIWRELRGVPAGSTVSYGELAKRVGRPGASRPVGMANARNPIALVVPCHRVIGADGKLTGYAGGLDRKRWLLEHESNGGRLF